MKTILFRYSKKHNFCVILRRFFNLAAILACLATVEVSASVQNEWTSPLKECWSFETPSPSRTPLASDNDQVFLTTSKGSVIALDQETGSVMWETDIGGNLWTDIWTSNDRLFATAFFGGSPSDSKAIFRWIDTDSGVPFWQIVEESVSPFYAMYADTAAATFVSGDGTILRASTDGESVWRRRFSTNITTNAFEINGIIVFGTSEGTIVLVDAKTGDIKTQLNANAIPTAIAGTSDGVVFSGDQSGRINAYDGKEVFPFWTAKTGAAISDISLYDGDPIVSSNDNFIYRLSSGNGNKIWKRKLAGRIIGSTMIDPNHAVYLTTGSTVAVILSLEDGNLVNKFDFGTPFVSGPVKINGGFAAQGESSVIAVSNNGCRKKKKAE